MPPLPVLTNVYRCALNWRNSSGGIAENVIHILGHSGVTVDDIGGLFGAFWTNDMNGYVSNTYRMASVSVTPLDGTSATVEFPMPDVTQFHGKQTGDVVPAVCGVIKLTTAARGRKARGRLFMGPAGESNIADGMQQTSNAATTTTAWQNFVDALSGNNTPLIIASYTHEQVFAVTVASAEVPCATQRRRQDRLR